MKLSKKIKVSGMLFLLGMSLIGTAAERALWQRVVNFEIVRVECINVQGSCLSEVVITPDDPPPPTEEEEEPYRFKRVEDGGEQ